MLQLSLNVSKKASFFKTRGSVVIEAELRPADAAEIPVAALLEQLFSQSPGFMPEISFDTDRAELEDLRGRPPETFEPGEVRRTSPPEEELFYGSGVFFDVDGHEEPVKYAPKEIPEVPFTVRVGTRFEAFRDGSHIVHRVVPTGSGVLDEIRPELSIRMLSRLFPARLDRVRLGLESFQPRVGGSLFGIIPTVTDRLYLELSKTRIKLRASCDYRGKNPQLPFAERGLLSLLDAALKKSGLFGDFSARLDGAMKLKAA